MIKITFPDGSVREYASGVTGLEIAESISSRLAQDVLACGVNGETVELNRPITEDASIQLYKWEDKEGKHAFWHTSAHLMAEALQELYPGTQFGIGPAIENGFYYDIMPAEGVVIRESVFPDIEKKVMELVQRKEALVRRDISKSDALKFFGDKGQTYKNELIATWKTVTSRPTPRAHSPICVAVRTSCPPRPSRPSRCSAPRPLTGAATRSVRR